METQKQHFIEAFEKSESYARRPKLVRWFSRPARHAYGLLMTYAKYPLTADKTNASVKIFTGDVLQVPLPAGLDIYLTGVKSHDSELRLMRFLLLNITPGMTVVDGGAHLGFFSVVISRLLRENGSVYAFEPGDEMFPVLQKNAENIPNLSIHKTALSAQSGEQSFFQFPTLYSEYNTAEEKSIDMDLRMMMSEVKVDAVSLDDFVEENGVVPDLIKLDVEGGELAALKGAHKILNQHNPVLIVEFRVDSFDVLYLPLVAYLKSLDYSPHSIDASGKIHPIQDIKEWLESQARVSDNIVFVKT